MLPIPRRPKFFATSPAFRRWLHKNHHRSNELWVGFYKKGSGRTSITWPESVDQALCYGWIDGVRKSIDDISYTIRFTPRRAGSIWSAVNVKRATELQKQGLLAPSGEEAFAKRKNVNRYSFEQRAASLPARYEQQIRKNGKAWKFFSSLPPSTKRVCTWWIISAKKEETQLRRLTILVEHSARGNLIPPLRFSKNQD